MVKRGEDGKDFFRFVMIKVRVILFGILRGSFPNHDSVNGLEIEITEGSRVGGLISHLNLKESSVGLVLMNGKRVKAEEQLKHNA